MDRVDPAVRPVLVLDFGSQYVQLIARRVRERHAFARIVRHDITVERARELNPLAIILSGGPSSVYADGAPRCDPKLFDLGVPVLGICYGMQLAVQTLGGEVKNHKSREYGRAHLKITGNHPFTRGLPQDTTVWMSHGDQVFDLPPEFEALATTPTCPYAAARHKIKPFYGVQFHPEVTHTPRGEQLFHNFLYDICGCRG